MNLELHVLRVRTSEIGVEMDAIGDLGHQSFGEARGPVPVVVLEHGGEGEAAGVRGVVVGAVVIHRPVHELKILCRFRSC